ncbi:MAG: anthranilate phosphoribosyltransferase [Sedimentisphaerales bacterium]|nr:anthranilate phosphoribosyltransferase [Sedimentisphaerales bacterium]
MSTITEYLEIILEGNDLTFEQAEALLNTIFEGGVANVQIAAFLAAMHLKKASVSELAGLAKSLREHAVKVNVDADNLVDTCGTGGAPLKTFNISTAAAIVAGGAGVRVAKHGNRGITSKCGSADVLEQLCVNIQAGPDVVARCIRQANIGFMFAPKFHPAMKLVQPIRKSLDFRTAFNVLGPLANPANVGAQVIGVAEGSLAQRIAGTLKALGTKRAFVVHSQGLDEISTMAPTKVIELKEGRLSNMELDPRQYGIEFVDLEALQGGDVADNAEIIRAILKGDEKGARKDIVVLNAAAAIIVSGLADDFGSAIKSAEQSISSGSALGCLEKLAEISNKD